MDFKSKNDLIICSSTLLSDLYFSGIKSHSLRRFVRNNILRFSRRDFLKPAIF